MNEKTDKYCLAHYTKGCIPCIEAAERDRVRAEKSRAIGRYNHIVNPTIRRSYCGIDNIEPAWDEALADCEPCEVSHLIEHVAG